MWKAGIGEKLKRSDQNILNLQSEIQAFFEKCDYPVIPHTNDEEWQKAVDYHRKLKIPIRFSVLAGEIIHHLRSSLDHLVWIFSTEDIRREKGGSIAFPVVCHDPPPPKEIERLHGQIQGIADARVRDRIIALQPYHRGADGANSPLAIIHEMDRFDKHRELVLINNCVTANVRVPDRDTEDALRLHQNGKPLSLRQRGLIGKALKQNPDARPNVAFSEFGGRKTQAVVPSLVQLIDATAQIIEPFETLAVLKKD